MTIEIKIGDSIKWDCTYTDPQGTAIDLTDYTIRSQARLQNTDDAPIFDVSIGNGITITDAVNGKFQILILDTTAYTDNVFNVDIEYTKAGEVISTETFYLDMIKAVTQ